MSDKIRLMVDAEWYVTPHETMGWECLTLFIGDVTHFRTIQYKDKYGYYVSQLGISNRYYPIPLDEAKAAALKHIGADVVGDAPLQTIEARYRDLLNRLGCCGHSGAISEIDSLRKTAGLDKPTDEYNKDTVEARDKVPCTPVVFRAEQTDEQKVDVIRRSIPLWARVKPNPIVDEHGKLARIPEELCGVCGTAKINGVCGICNEAERKAMDFIMGKGGDK